MAGEKLAQYLMSMSNSGISTNFLHGVVTSVKPVKIKIEGLPELKENQLILSRNVKELKIKIPNEENVGHTHKVEQLTTNPSGEDSHTHTINEFKTSKELQEIMIWRGLKVNDKVFIIQSNDKQKFYVVEVVEGDTNK